MYMFPHHHWCGLHVAPTPFARIKCNRHILVLWKLNRNNSVDHPYHGNATHRSFQFEFQASGKFHSHSSLCLYLSANALACSVLSIKFHEDRIAQAHYHRCIPRSLPFHKRTTEPNDQCGEWNPHVRCTHPLATIRIMAHTNIIYVIVRFVHRRWTCKSIYKSTVCTHAQYYWVDVTHWHRYECESPIPTIPLPHLNAKYTKPTEYCDSAIAHLPLNDVTYIMYANATAKSSLLHTRHTYVWYQRTKLHTSIRPIVICARMKNQALPEKGKKWTLATTRKKTCSNIRRNRRTRDERVHISTQKKKKQEVAYLACAVEHSYGRYFFGGGEWLPLLCLTLRGAHSHKCVL